MKDQNIEELKDQIRDINLTIKNLGFEDIATNKIFLSAKDRFSSWFYWSLFGLFITYLGTMVSVAIPMLDKLNTIDETTQKQEQIVNEIQEELQNEIK